MLDVHLPHPSHTWRDFWIHLGTITVGLLIAISLEQTVEALHRLHLRHELEASLRAECEGNRRKADGNFVAFDHRIAWLLGLRRDIDTMIATNGKANLPYRPPVGTLELVLDTAAWDTAKDDQRLTLLPNDLASSYSLDYKLLQMCADLRVEYLNVLTRQRAFQSRFADVASPDEPVLGRMNPQQLDRYAMLVSDTLLTVMNEKLRFSYFYGVNNAVLKGGINDVEGRMREQEASLKAHATDYKKLADASAPVAERLDNRPEAETH